MAREKRLTDADLIAWLAKDGARFGFFQAVDVIERMTPGAVPVGHVGPAELEAIRFEHDPDLTFHTSDVKWIKPRDPSRSQMHTVIRSTFLGLFGAVSPLPMTMSEDVLAADAAEQPSLRAFYDLFHHRLISLFFRVWQKNRFPSAHRVDMGDAFTRRAFALVGVDVAGAIPTRGIAPFGLLGLSPLIARRSRSPRALEIVASRLLDGIAVKVESFVLRRTPLLPAQRMTLGVRNTTLGTDTAIGASVADRAGRYRVVMGPLSQEQFDAVSPGGKHFQTLASICDHFSGGILEAEVEIQMSVDQVPRFRLGDSRGARLGQTTRIGSKDARPLRSRFVLGGDAELAKPRVVSDPTFPNLSTTIH